LRIVTLLEAPRRTASVPICSSARAPASAQIRSPVISGRFGVASTHSSSPAGEKLTAPARFAILATRVGGSAAAMPQARSAARPTSACVTRSLMRRMTMLLSLSSRIGV
jgi:hypothetical protein